MSSSPVDILARGGAHVLIATHAMFGAGLGFIGIAAALYAVAMRGIVVYRDTLPGKMLLYSHRNLALWLSARHWGPTGLMAGGVALAFGLSGWVEHAGAWRPTWWPSNIPYCLVVGSASAWLAHKVFSIESLQRWLGVAKPNLWGMVAGFSAGTLAGLVFPAPWYPTEFAIPMRPALAWLMLAPVLVLIGMHQLWKRMGREKVENHIDGNAGFASRGEISKNKDALVAIPIKVSHRGAAEAYNTKLNGPLGHTVLEVSQDALWTHVLLDGNSGSGKDLSAYGPIVFSLVVGCGRRPDGKSYKYILQDVKGVATGKDQYEQNLGKSCILWGAAAMGQWASMRWNPIRETLDSQDPQGECLALASMLMPDDDGPNAFIPRAGRPILATCIRSGNYPTIKDIYDDIQNRGLLQVTLANDCAPGDITALLGKNMVEWVQGEFKARLGVYADGGWGEQVTSGHDFSLDEFLETGGYVLSAEGLPDRKAPLTLMWQMLFRRLIRQRKERNLFLLFNEALAAGKSLSRDGLNLLREDRVSIWAGIQHYDGLREVYGREEGDSLIASFGSKIYLLHGMSDTDREHLSRKLSKRTTVRKIKRHGHSEEEVKHGDLLPISTIGSLARPQKEYWAVFDFISQTNPNPSTQLGLPILAQVVATTPYLQRKPTQDEIEAVTCHYGEREAFTPPPLVREVVEHIAQTIGRKDLLDFLPEKEREAELIEAIPSVVDILDTESDGKDVERQESQESDLELA